MFYFISRSAALFCVYFIAVCWFKVLLNRFTHFLCRLSWFIVLLENSSIFNIVLELFNRRGGLETHISSPRKVFDLYKSQYYIDKVNSSASRRLPNDLENVQRSVIDFSTTKLSITEFFYFCNSIRPEISFNVIRLLLETIKAKSKFFHVLVSSKRLLIDIITKMYV